MNRSDGNTMFNEDFDKVTVTDVFIGYFICAVNIPLCLTALLGNAAVLTAIWKTSSLHFPEHILLASLAFTDFAVGLVVQPLFISLHFAKYLSSKALFEAIVTLYPFTVWYLCGVSFLIVTAITVDRFLALELHLRYHVVVTHSRTALLVAAIWAVYGCISSLRLWNTNAFYPSVAVMSLVCLLGSFAAYWRIFRVVRRHQAQIYPQAWTQHGSQSTLLPRLKKSIWNTFYVYCIFFSCYTPHVSFMIFSFITERCWLSMVVDITSTIVFLNSTLNPLLYCWRIRDIRYAVKGVFTQLYGK